MDVCAYFRSALHPQPFRARTLVENRIDDDYLIRSVDAVEEHKVPDAQSPIGNLRCGIHESNLH